MKKIIDHNQFTKVKTQCDVVSTGWFYPVWWQKTRDWVSGENFNNGIVQNTTGSRNQASIDKYYGKCIYINILHIYTHKKQWNLQVVILDSN